MALAALEWANRREDGGVEGVAFTEQDAEVRTTDYRRQARTLQVPIDDNPAEVVQRVAADVSLIAPDPSDPVVYAESTAPWRHHWATLLDQLGRYSYMLRDDPASTLRFASVVATMKRERRIADVELVDAKGGRFVTRIDIDPAPGALPTLLFDIPSWIRSKGGQLLPDGSRLYELHA